MVQCYEIQDGINKLKSELSDKCRIVTPNQVFFILELIDAIRRCIEEEGEGNENAVLYIPQIKTDIEKEIARNNIGAISKEEVIEYIIENSDYLAEQLGYELKENKQNNLNPDGTGIKYPTVDAVNNVIEEIRNEINNIAGDKNFVYEQNVPTTLWEIDHPLNKKVSVTVVDSAGTVYEGRVIINDGNRVTIQFNIPFWGYAYLN